MLTLLLPREVVRLGVHYVTQQERKKKNNKNCHSSALVQDVQLKQKTVWCHFVKFCELKHGVPWGFRAMGPEFLFGFNIVGAVLAPNKW